MAMSGVGRAFPTEDILTEEAFGISSLASYHSKFKKEHLLNQSRGNFPYSQVS